jgi:siroheme synthase (precorrin-2 oxidase/ferrochelatase)
LREAKQRQQRCSNVAQQPAIMVNSSDKRTACANVYASCVGRKPCFLKGLVLRQRADRNGFLANHV